MKTPRSKKWKACFKKASRHRKSHAGFDRALHAYLARNFGDTVEGHHDASQNTIREVKRLQERLRSSLRDPPDCGNAVTFALRLSYIAGKYDVHRYEGKGRGLRGGRGANRANAGLFYRVEKMCVVKPKSKAAERKMRAVWR